MNTLTSTRFRITTRSSGFNILELLITLSVTAILISVAVPSFAALIGNNQVKSATANLQSSLQQARGHALTNTVIVIVCQRQAGNENKCANRRTHGQDWVNGWMSYADSNGNNELDDADKIISITQDNQETAVVFNQSGRLRFFPNGSARSAGFYICNSSSEKVRHLKLLHTGRTRIVDSLSKKNEALCRAKADAQML